MKIIRHGCLEGIKYRAICHYCNCEFQYDSFDVRRFEDKPIEGFIYCPECNHRVNALGYNKDKLSEIDQIKRLQQNEIPAN